MNIETFERRSRSIEETLKTSMIEVRELLMDPRVPDSIKKIELVRHLGAAQAELMLVKHEISQELERCRNKKFWQFWK